MKRIFWVLFVFNFLIINVKGETFYTDYILNVSNSEVYDETLLNNELHRVVIKKGYNNYKQEIINKGYYELNKQPKEVKYQALDDYIYKEVYSKKILNDTIQYQTNLINKFNEVRSIGIRCFVSKAIFRPENITITYNDKVIAFTIYKSNYDYESIPDSYTRVELDLGKKYPLKDLRISIKFQDESLSYLAFMLDVYENLYYLTAPYDYYTVHLYRSSPEEVININFVNKEDFLDLAKKMSWIREKNTLQ